MDPKHAPGKVLLTCLICVLQVCSRGYRHCLLTWYCVASMRCRERTMLVNLTS